MKTLKTGDAKEAKARRAVIELEQIKRLDALLAAEHVEPDSTNHFHVIAQLATSRGFGYQTAQELSEADIREIVSRVNSLIASNDPPGSASSIALLGGVERPRLTLMTVSAGMAERFPLEVMNKAQKQKETWGHRWNRPSAKLARLLGYDPVFNEITRQQAALLKSTLLDAIIDGDMKGASAQKELRNLDLMWRKFHLSLGIDRADVPISPFRDLAIGLADADEETWKSEVPNEWIQKMIAPGAMATANDELRALICALVETGCRQSEVTDIAPEHIQLDSEVPHLRLQDQKGEFARVLKNKASKRSVPLVGIALEAMKLFPTGFPRYRGKGTFSAAANSYLRENKLLPEGVSIGGLRHSFESRLKRAGVEIDDRGELMGHSVKRVRGRERYGDAMPLEQKVLYHRAIAFPVPERAFTASS